MQMIEQSSLYFSSGSSDKEYHAQIICHNNDLCDVTFQYGPRGGTLRPGSKTTAPVEYQKAKKLFDALIREKTAKGYSPGEAGVAFQHTGNAERVVEGMQPQLLNPIDEDEVETYINDDRYLAQEKEDGERRMVQKIESAVGVNRNGLAVALPSPIANAFEVVQSRRIEVDAEQVGDVLKVFDLLLDANAGVNLRDMTCIYRLDALEKLRPLFAGTAVQIVYTAYTTDEKRALYESVKARGGEGIVFKLKSAPYEPGRPASGGSQLKFKFYATATVLVRAVNDGKRSVGISVFNTCGEPVEIGNVTIPPNHPIPAAGSLIEVRYLYAFPGGSLYQPTYVRPRRDLDLVAASISQLKYKAGSDRARLAA